jgi:hypothetical protein
MPKSWHGFCISILAQIKTTSALSVSAEKNKKKIIRIRTKADKEKAQL